MSTEQNMGSVDESGFNQTILEMQQATSQVREEKVETPKKEIDLPELSHDEEYGQEEPLQKSAKQQDEIDPVDREFASKRKYSNVEQEALTNGWRPKDQFSGNAEDYIEAKEFLDRRELYDKITHQSKALKELKFTVKELADLNKRQQEMLMKEKADYLLQQKRLAIESGNVSEAEKFEEAYHTVAKEVQPQPETKPQQQAVIESPPAAVEFARRNIAWFNEDSPENTNMKNYAIKKEAYLNQLYPEWSDERRLMETERAVKEFFSYRFKNANRERAPKVAVNDSQNYSVKSKKITFNQLPSHYKAIVRRMSQATGLSENDYAQQLYDAGKIS